MKVLDTLKDYIEDENRLGDLNYSHYSNIIDYVNEAIFELEELESRSCENCKYNKEQENFMIYCEKEICEDGSKMMWHSFTKDFCCKFWESKGRR